MEYRGFENADLCWPLVRRRATEYFLSALAGVGEVILSRGRSLVFSGYYPTPAAYHASTYRLRRAGLIVYRESGSGVPVLVLTEEGRAGLPETHDPRRCWRRDWNGLWYVLTYDVPEQRRPYREALRGFLKRMRMGCLHRSVWVSARDIRPEYDDLVKAGGVDEHAFLFQSMTVLETSAEDVVESAWDMARLYNTQAWYIEVCKDNLTRLQAEPFTRETAFQLGREEMEAYMAAMEEDPLLPRTLWPSDYQGEKVYALHRRFLKTLTQYE